MSFPQTASIRDKWSGHTGSQVSAIAESPQAEGNEMSFAGAERVLANAQLRDVH